MIRHFLKGQDSVRQNSLELKYKRSISLIAWIGLLLTVSLCLDLLIKNNIGAWYLTLDRSVLSPPSYLFRIVWTVLYMMIAVSGWLIWQSKPIPGLSVVKKLYVAQLTLNWGWTPLFFHYHMIGLSMVSLFLIIALVVLILVLIFKLFKSLKLAAIWLLPYLLWSIFAGYLNIYIWLNN